MEKLKMAQHRDTKARNYFCIWRIFNKFLVRLDFILDSWEERLALFCTYMVDVNKVQSSTLKCYISAIKHILKCDNYKWCEEKVWLNSLIRSCRNLNDQILTRFPIHYKLLELILFEVGRMFGDKQPFLECLYRTISIMAYYGLLRMSEVVETEGKHAIKVKDVLIGQNKNKIKLILYTSKTHGLNARPQEIKITALKGKLKGRFFHPFQLTRSYLSKRGSFIDTNKKFFVFTDRSRVKQHHMRVVLKKAITNINLDANCYNFQSFRIGRGSDLLKFGFCVESIKWMGRSKSNAVYKYLRHLWLI